MALRRNLSFRCNLSFRSLQLATAALMLAPACITLPNRPLNPVHHLWRPLVCLLGFPFVKTELVRRNPGRLPQVGSWTALVGPESPTSASMLAGHLAEIGP